jgi:hypothetical protein
MKDAHDAQVIDLTGRIRSLEQFTGTLVARPTTGTAESGAIPIHDAPTGRVPRPRRARVFLRNGEGHGVFADLTLTAPRPRPASD